MMEYSPSYHLAGVVAVVGGAGAEAAVAVVGEDAGPPACSSGVWWWLEVGGCDPSAKDRLASLHARQPSGAVVGLADRRTWCA